MPLRLYNTLSRKEEVFKPLKKGQVTLYTCGPTVYNFAHIGNLRTYIFEDILERVLRWNGYGVKRAMNITDVGHLTGDSDAGADKMEQAAKTAADVKKIAAKYTRAFASDMRKLNNRLPRPLAPATKFIPEQIAIIKLLLKRGYAYETPAAVYFDVRKFKNYGRLSGQSLKEKLTGAREEVVFDPAKRHPADFALWFKLVGRFKNHLLHWRSPWGWGFPGWHIECSAISRALLGQPFDIHTGGVDHIGTHHANEIAQSAAAFGKPLARLWMHGEFLVIDAKRMGKSEGNFLTIAELEKRGFSPLAFRYLVLGAHYRSKLNFTWESLAAAASGLKNLQAQYAAVAKAKPSALKLGKKYPAAFERAISGDLGTPEALAIFQKALRDKKLPAGEKKTLAAEFDKIFGLDLAKGARGFARRPEAIPEKVRQLAARREELRGNKQFMQADALRQEIEQLGYVLEDTPNGPVIKPK